MIDRCCLSSFRLRSEVVVKKKRNAILFSQLQEYKRLLEILGKPDEPDEKKGGKGKEKKNQSVISDRKSKQKKSPSASRDNYHENDDAMQILGRDQRAQNAKEGFKSLLEKEKKRFEKLKKQFDLELLKQTPLEQEIKKEIRGFVAKIYSSSSKATSPPTPSLTDTFPVDYYRVKTSTEQRKLLVDRLLVNPVIVETLKDKLEITDKIREMGEFEVQ